MYAKVQDCGCVAIPEELVKQTGLGPGAAYEMTLTPDGRGVMIVPAEAQAANSKPHPFAGGTACG